MATNGYSDGKLHNSNTSYQQITDLICNPGYHDMNQTDHGVNSDEFGGQDGFGGTSVHGGDDNFGENYAPAADDGGCHNCVSPGSDPFIFTLLIFFQG